MAVIWKYVLSSPVCVLSLPSGGVIRHVGRCPASQLPALWIEHEPDAAKLDRTFRVFATGEMIEPGVTFLGTVITDPLVLHVYERDHPHA